jgi:hypothetical protein
MKAFPMAVSMDELLALIEMGRQSGGLGMPLVDERTALVSQNMDWDGAELSFAQLATKQFLQHPSCLLPPLCDPTRRFNMNANVVLTLKLSTDKDRARRGYINMALVGGCVLELEVELRAPYDGRSEDIYKLERLLGLPDGPYISEVRRLFRVCCEEE